jgi:D-glycero-D-manno-heptose 1,7-bisphosphate phosphatase
VGERQVAGGPGARAGVLLDRDGTLIDVVRDEETGAISTAFHPSHLRLLGGVVEALRLLEGAGFVLAIATNQPGPAKGHFSAAAVTRTNDALVALLAAEGVHIASVKACIHHPDGGPGGDASLVGPCDCRKPKAGMLDALVGELGLARERTWMIGDSAADIEAGHAAKLRTGLVFPANRCELCPLRPPAAGGGGVAAASARAHKVPPDLHGSSLLAVVRALLVSA